MSDLLFGFILVTIGSILQGSWAVPMGYTKKWQWENTWLIFSLLSMITFNLIIGSFFVPNLFRIYGSAFPLVLRFAVILKALGLNIMRCAGALCAPLCPCFIRIRDTKQAVANRFNELYALFNILLSKNRFCLVINR